VSPFNSVITPFCKRNISEYKITKKSAGNFSSKKSTFESPVQPISAFYLVQRWSTGIKVKKSPRFVGACATKASRTHFCQKAPQTGEMHSRAVSMEIMV